MLPRSIFKRFKKVGNISRHGKNELQIYSKPRQQPGAGVSAALLPHLVEWKQTNKQTAARVQ
jgi:hypothetical protein